MASNLFGPQCVLFAMSICSFNWFPFWFLGQDLCSIASVPGHCLPFAFDTYSNPILPRAGCLKLPIMLYYELFKS